jgi:hypothetical protein
MMKNVKLFVVAVGLTILATASAAEATLTPFTAVAGINPATGVAGIKVVITVGTSSQTLTNGTSTSGLTCSGLTCTIQITNTACPVPSGGTAACRQFGGFDIFPLGTGQIVVLNETNTDSIQVRNLRVVNRSSTATQIKIEASGNVSKDVDITASAHGMKLVGTFYRTVKNDLNGTPTLVAATAQAVSTPSFPASVATVQGSFVYLKNTSACLANPVPANTTCQGGRTNYASPTPSHTVGAGSLSNNSIKLGVPILILDSGTPSSTKCINAFTTGTDCQSVDHTRVTVTLTLAKPTSITSVNTTLKCSKAPCSSVDYVELVASAAGYSGQTEEIVFLGTGLVTEAHQSLKPDAEGSVRTGSFTISAFGTFDADGNPVLDTSTCNCFDVFDSQIPPNLVVPGVTFSPGLNGNPAKAISCTRHGVDTDFKFDVPDTGFTCADVPQSTYVVRAFCTVNVTAEETTQEKKNDPVITTNVSGPIQGIVNGEGQIPITPCQ